jgi:hypothetical protein
MAASLRKNHSEQATVDQNYELSNIAHLQMNSSTPPESKDPCHFAAWRTTAEVALAVRQSIGM